MAKSPNRPDPEDRGEADVDFLFQDESSGRGSPSSSRGSKPSSGPEGYDLAGMDEGGSDAEVRPPVLPSSAPPRSPKPKRPRREAFDDEAEDESDRAEESPVSEVWSRGAEWGPDLVTVGVLGLIVLGLTYVLLSSGNVGLGFLVLFAGGLVCVLLSYPIVVTLERPVRMTPEQAARDFFGALSHHFPHYRRMWLLLSDRGREQGPFESFAGFRSYWKDRLAALRKKGNVKGGTPLTFEVAEFQSEKSAGKTATRGDVTVRVLARGRESEGPIASYSYSIGLVKGPDRMWYLNQGTLPDRSS
jgi:hypothetical protein